MFMLILKKIKNREKISITLKEITKISNKTKMKKIYNFQDKNQEIAEDHKDIQKQIKNQQLLQFMLNRFK
jgi:hypothetical protein